MRISLILSSLQLSGGVRVVIQYANRLCKRGYQISFIVPKGTIDPEIKPEVEPGIQIIESKHPLNGRRDLFALLRQSLEMALVIPSCDVIVATHTPTTAVSFIAGRVLRKGNIIWFYQDYLEMFDKRPIEKWLIRNALRWHKLTITVSEACVEELHSFSSGKVINIGEGLDTKNTYHPLEGGQKKSTGIGKKVLFFLGDMRLRKGMADFLLAAEKVYGKEPNLYLWIASKENIELQTKVPHERILRPTDTELVHLYASCDVFVSASWYEGFGLPPLEAMACGAAVVTTDSRGVREFAVDGENCLLVPPRNPDKLAEAIQTLLANPELAEKLRKNGPITAEKFDWELATNRFEAALAIIIHPQPA